MTTYHRSSFKTLSLGVTAAALLAAVPLSATTSLAGSLDALRAGSGGYGFSGPGAVQLAYDAEVQRVQRGLNRLGYDAGPVDGLMGSKTRSAIEEYQRDNGLLVTGQASASLSEHIRTNVREKRAERRSETQADASTTTDATVERQTILQLQSDLRRLGYSVPVVSGRVDSDTAQAIRAYQRDNNLLVDGRLSPELVAHVQGKTSAGTVIEDRGTIRSVQQALNERGYDAGPADGIMGSKTRDAIRTFQSDASLPLSGTISQDTLVQLGLASGAASGGTTTSTPTTGSDEPRTVLSDSFADGDFLRNPRWEVVAGTWRVTDGSALTSDVPIVRTSGTSSQQLGPEMIKGILGNALGVQTQQTQNLAAIHSRAALTNSFHLNMRLSADGQPAVLNVGPYQGSNVGYGYRLEAHTGDNQPLHLLAITANGTTVIGTSESAVRFDDGSKHTIDWRRDANGLQTIELDGRVALQVLDRTFQDPFDGVSLINAGGTWSVDDIEAQSLTR